jgi:hypothetical protein
MMQGSYRSRIAPPAPSTDVRQDVVEQQLDNINVLAEALAKAISEDAAEQIAHIRASLERHTLALGWNAGPCLPAVFAYANARADSDDDLFAPSLILASAAPEHPETRRLQARASEDVQVLIEWVASAQGRIPDIP